MRSLKLSEIQLSYLSGFIDADGCINGQIIRSRSYKRKFKLQVSVVLFQKKSRRWFIDSLYQSLNMGYIRERNDGNLEYTIKSSSDLTALLPALIPYLVLKKPQAILVLKILDLLKNVNSDLEFLEVCKLIDKFKTLNDSKKRINTSETVAAALSLVSVPPVET